MVSKITRSTPSYCHHATGSVAGGLFGDGPSQVYLNFAVPAGRHMLAARLRDSDRAEGFDYERSEDVDIAPGRRLVIEFRQEQGGFNFARSGPSTEYPKLAQRAGRTP